MKVYFCDQCRHGYQPAEELYTRCPINCSKRHILSHFEGTIEEIRDFVNYKQLILVVSTFNINQPLKDLIIEIPDKEKESKEEALENQIASR